MRKRIVPKTSAGQIAFTLVELLVVIAVVALLAALLLPALGRAKAQSRAMACLANARQIALLHHQYTSDFNGHVLSPSTGGSWHAMENLPRLYMGDKRSGYLGPLHPFFRCPVATYPTGSVASDTVGYFYGVNSTLYEAKKTKIHSLVNPSRSYLLAENNQQAYCVIYAAAGGNTALNVERHGGRCSVIFNDSHAGLLESRRIPCKTSYPSVADGTLINTFFASDTPPVSSTFLGL